MADSFSDTITQHTMDLDLTKTKTKRESLTTLCTDMFLIIIRMRESENLGTPHALRKLITHYITLFQNNCKKMGMQQEAIDHAVYALVSLLDETVMIVPGECRDFWFNNPMQLELFGDNLAGEGFFNRLTKLMNEPDKYKDVLEIYYLCLCLGFEGKYRVNNAPQRELIIESLARLLLRAGNRPVSGLSPHGRRTATAYFFKRGFRKFIPLWLLSLLLASFLIVEYVVLFITTRQTSEGIFLSIF